MSIAENFSKLTVALENALMEASRVSLIRMREVKDGIREKIGGGDGPPPPPASNLLIAALNQIHDGGMLSDLDKKQRKALCWGLGSTVTIGKQTIVPLEDRVIPNMVFRYIDGLLEERKLRKNIFIGLLYSYFEYPDGGHSCKLVAWKDLCEIVERSLLYFEDMYASKPRQWFSRVLEHKDMLGSKAAEYAYRQFKADPNIREIRYALNIPDQSWIWNDIVRLKIRDIGRQTESGFFNDIETYILFAKQFRKHTDLILAAVLERYKDTSRKFKQHTELKDFAIELWGAPGIGVGRSRWNTYVSEEARFMVTNWIAREDLRVFFEVISDARQGIDKDRFLFWLRYLGSVTFTKIYLSQNAKYTTNPELKQYINKNKGAYGWIDSTSSNNNTNAFLLCIGDFCFLEFSHTSNACYVYRRNKMPFSPEANNLRLYEMKSLLHADNRIIHHLGWQSKAKWKLRDMGIYPD